MLINRTPLLLALFFLFLLQLLSNFIESIYAFALLVTSFTIHVAAVLLIFSPLLLIPVRRDLKRPALLGLAFAGLACYLAAPLLAPGGKLIFSGLGLAALLVFFPAWLAGCSGLHSRSFIQGLLMAVALLVFLRAVGSGSDWSQSSITVRIILVMLAGWLLLKAGLSPDARAIASSMSFGRTVGLALGVTAVFLMIYFAFASPTVIARWTGASYLVIIAILLASTAAFGAAAESVRFSGWLDRRLVLGWNALFVLALTFTILPHQIPLPADPGVYPIDMPPVAFWAVLPLWIMLALSPVLGVNLALLVSEISAGRPSTSQLGGAFGIGALYCLAMIFLHIFTTTYDYVPVIGPLLRDRFWLVYLLAGLGLGLPVLLVRREQFTFPQAEDHRLHTTLTGILAIAAFLVAIFNSPRPPAAAPEAGLKIMTYNIQQGYDSHGSKNLPGQLQVIQALNPDVIGLQESDTARIANGNVDAVRYFADHLEMYSYYGPTTTSGTFGIALLSRYPIENPQTFFMYSEGEQTAAIQAQITANGKIYNIFVTHLGNDGPLTQLENLLVRVQGLENVVAMGDYNFRPATRQYSLVTQTLADSWLLKWPGGKDIPGYAAERRIDHIFVSPGMEISASEYVLDPASDHPYLFTEIR